MEVHEIAGSDFERRAERGVPAGRNAPRRIREGVNPPPSTRRSIITEFVFAGALARRV